MKIQFILCGDGASHKFLGITPYFGMKKLGIETEYVWYSRKIGSLLENPDYIFVLKPNVEQINAICKRYPLIPKCLIISDQRLDKEIEHKFQFFVTCSQSWQKEYQAKHEGKPCYLIKEEYDYCMQKNHEDSQQLKVVTMGYSNNLTEHFLDAIEQIKKVTNDITIVSGVNEPEFKECKFEKFKPNSDYFLKPEWDRIAVSQFNKFDIGIITQYKNSGRPSTRGKAFLYAGLPIIAPNVKEYRNIWNNKSIILNSLYDNIEEISLRLEGLKDKTIRQVISDSNYKVIKENSGAIKSAESFLKGIQDYENWINS